MGSSIYDYPQYCEVVFNSRDVIAEADVIEESIRRFSRIPVKRVLDICCGIAPHAGELARRGYEYVGLDNNRNMIRYCNEHWSSASPRPEFVLGDMLSFNTQAPVDFAFTMVGSLIYLTTRRAFASHFDAVSNALRPGGLYFLDACVSFDDPRLEKRPPLRQSVPGGPTVSSKVKTRLVDPADQIYEENWSFDIDDHGECLHINAIERWRAIFPQEFLDFFDQRPDFRILGWWQEWDFNRPITTVTDVQRPLVIVQRAGD